MLLKRGWTNNILHLQQKDVTYYLVPVYLRLKVKNIVSMQIQSLTGELNCVFVLSIPYGKIQVQQQQKKKLLPKLSRDSQSKRTLQIQNQLDQNLVQYLQNSIQLAFNKDTNMLLDEENMNITRKKDEKKKLLTFTVRKIIATRLQCYTFWSPFQTVNYIITLAIRSLKTTINGKTYHFKFNLMDFDDIDTKFSLPESKQRNFGMFSIADNHLSVKYTKEYSYLAAQNKQFKSQKVKPVENQNKQYKRLWENTISKQKLKIEDDRAERQPLSKGLKINNFQYAHFILPTYKTPYPAIFSIFFPLILLGIINIAIFYQNNKQTGKMNINIASVLISFIALIPTIRESISVSPTISFTQILVFVEAFTTILTLIHMVIYRSIDDYTLKIEEDGFLIACIVITSIVTFCILMMFCVHKFYQLRVYHRRKTEKKNFEFDHEKWFNQQCDQFMNTELGKYIKTHLKQLLPDQIDIQN